MIKSIIKRFIKGFLSGGIASMVVVLESAQNINTFGDIKTLAVASTIAFISGGLLAIEKWISWKK